ncbi:MAG: stress response translation initiation inhibitor YciH [Proteobacteria bacterium]|nr:stress response translation initiation inhibitor YciH [Pseudomonadota bacterium]MDA0927467.1 stress response translation initiation inhibitor YciH [Pseudomonadota bacterium]
MSGSRLVYSTSGDNQCARCGKALHKCKCPAESPVDTDRNGVRIERQSKGRGGKQVTVISGLLLPRADLSTLLKQLKQSCSSGGTIKGNILEIQGDCRQQALALLGERGIKAKISGG